ncbi:unnamed protein product [Dovyalis caffra]|uniref:Uncharacterized protein n=1 Tax=Dovyalis caffra TaxID=77055 RepID=A0AAV1S3A7_9ROSI|nr:unnamed protein product [Dovyalis caffra]
MMWKLELDVANVDRLDDMAIMIKDSFVRLEESYKGSISNDLVDFKFQFPDINNFKTNSISLNLNYREFNLGGVILKDSILLGCKDGLQKDVLWKVELPTIYGFKRVGLTYDMDTTYRFKEDRLLGMILDGKELYLMEDGKES